MPATEETSGVANLNDALGALESELERLKSAADQIETSKQAAREAVEAAQRVGEAASALTGPTTALVERLDKVDFPSRLDKVDATVSALGVELQNIQGRLDGVERSLKDDLGGLRKSVERRVAESQRAMMDGVAQHSENVRSHIGQVRTLAIATLVALAVVIILVVVLVL